MKSGSKKGTKGVGQSTKRKKGKAKTKPKSGINRKTGSAKDIKPKRKSSPRGGKPAGSSQSQNPRKKPRKNPVKRETTLKKRSRVINYFGRSNET